jgi:ABC-type multidrug transport system fused ATPase/permease subunit
MGLLINNKNNLMKTSEILNEIEKHIKEQEQENEKLEDVKDGEKKKDTKKNFMYLVLLFLFNILKLPIQIFEKYLKEEILKAVKKDLKLYFLTIFLLIVLMVFFSVFWLSISFGVGVYFYEKGYSMLISMVYSGVFQILSFLAVSLITLFSFRKIKSVKTVKKIIHFIDDPKD